MKNLLSVAFVLLVALSTTACGSGNGDAADPAPSISSAPDTSPGTLLMSTFDESTHTFLETFTIRPDGSDRQVIPMPDEGGGRWSHAGDEIAVGAVLDDGRIGTAILSRDGTVLRVLSIDDATLNLACPFWSPDDTRLACEGWDDTDEQRTGIYMVQSSDGSGMVRVTAPEAGLADRPGDFTPDGSQILFKRAHEEDPGPLLVVSVDGGTPTPVGDSIVEDPGRYSPDGDRILTSSGGRLLVLDADGAVVNEIAENGFYLFGPVWSLDGTRIAFSQSTSAFRADVFTSLPDGTDRRQVTDTDENEIRVEWGP